MLTNVVGWATKMHFSSPFSAIEQGGKHMKTMLATLALCGTLAAPALAEGQEHCTNNWRPQRGQIINYSQPVRSSASFSIGGGSSKVTVVIGNSRPAPRPVVCAPVVARPVVCAPVVTHPVVCAPAPQPVVCHPAPRQILHCEPPRRDSHNHGWSNGRGNNRDRGGWGRSNDRGHGQSAHGNRGRDNDHWNRDHNNNGHRGR